MAERDSGGGVTIEPGTDYPSGGSDPVAGAGTTQTGSRPTTINVIANADGSIIVNADDIKVGVLATDAQHGNRGGGGVHAVATSGAAGFMSATDKTKLDAIASVSLLSIVDWFSTSPTAPAVAAGSFTTGCKFSVTSAATVTGVRFYWAGATARTIKCCLRDVDAGGTILKTVDVSVNGAGIYTGTFASSQAITIKGNGALYSVTIWEKSATEYSRWSTKPTTTPTLPFFVGVRLLWSNFSAWVAGDANPNNTSATEHYAVEPVFA